MTSEPRAEAVKPPAELKIVAGKAAEPAPKPAAAAVAPARPAAPAAAPARPATPPVKSVPAPDPNAREVPPRKPPDPALRADVHKAIRAVRRAKRRLILLSLFFMVALPTLLTGAYFAFFASDQYASEARFAIRGSEQISADFLGMLSGTTAGVSVGDSYILTDYINSREIVDKLEAKLGIRAHFAAESNDWFARAAADQPIEEFVEYWRRMVSVEFDSYTGIVVLKVRAFDPRSAVSIASAIVEESRSLVNRLSEQSRLDTVALAQRAVQFAEERLREARAQVAAFQDRESTLNPGAIAEAHERLVAELEANLAKTESELSQIRTLVGPEAPSRRILEGRIKAIKEQIAEQRLRVSDGTNQQGGGTAGGADSSISGQLTAFQALETEVEFSQKAYISALASLEAARLEAKRDQRYLATFVNPLQPEAAEYPRRAVNTFIVFLGCAVAWGISALLYAAVRDHMV